MRWVFEILALCLIASVADAATYYVATDGSDSNAGTTVNAPWRSLLHASRQVRPGDVVHVKAGDYGADRINLEVDGTATAPIQFVGYRHQPGEALAIEWRYPDRTALDASQMPLLDGGNRASGIGIDLNARAHIRIRNFQITRFEVGVSAIGSEFVTIETVVAAELGDVNDPYSGRGIAIGSSGYDNVLSDCVVYNAAAEGISVIGDRNLVRNCRVYADDDSTGHASAMDYYIHIRGDDNRVIDNYVERVGDLGHPGHGIGVKDYGTRNLFSGNEAVNITGGLYVRHGEVVGNRFEDNVVRHNIGILIRDGASGNVFDRTHIQDARWPIAYMDTHEDPGGTLAGFGNLISNSLIERTTDCVITYSRYATGYGDTGVEDNEITHATIDGAPALYCSERPNQDNRLTNSVVANVSRLTSSSSTQPLRDSIEYSNFWNVGFSVPGGEGNGSADPGWVNPASSDYRLLPSSPLVDAGLAIDGVITDILSIARPSGDQVDIGAYEHAAGGSAPDTMPPASPILID